MKTILLLTDFSEKARYATSYAMYIARRLKCNICLYNTFTPPDIGVPSDLLNNQIEEHFKEQTNSRLAQLANAIREQDEGANENFMPDISFMCKSGEISSLGWDIENLIREKNIWLVVMGFKGDEALSNFIPGSETFSVIEHSPCPVLLIPSSVRIMKIKRIAVLEETLSFSPRLTDFLANFRAAFDASVITCSQPMEKGPLHYNKLELEKQLQHEVDEINEDEFEFLLQEEGSNSADILILELSHNIHFKNLFYGRISKSLINNTNLPLLVFTRNF